VSPPNRGKLMVRQAHHEVQAVEIALYLILSLSKDEAGITAFFGILLV
jgi:hypothetical protein